MRVDLGSLTLSGVISGPARLVKVNAGTATISNPSNSFAGGVTVANGRLNISSDGNLGTVPAAVTADNIIISTATTSGTLSATDNTTLAANRGITTVGSASYFDVAATKVLTVNGPITGPQLFKRSGAGRLDLAGSNAFTGAVNVGTNNVNSGIIRLLNDNALAGATTLNIAGNGTGTSIVELDGGRSIPSVPVSVVGRTNATFFRGVSGTNTFNGPITITAGGATNYKIESNAGGHAHPQRHANHQPCGHHRASTCSTSAARARSTSDRQRRLQRQRYESRRRSARSMPARRA